MPYTKAQAKEKITKLVEDFRAHERTLERAPEAEIENSFIRPLFEALNWNTTNQGLSYAQYEFKVQATNKKGLRPDYVLHLDGRDVLVMDAKQVKYSMKDPRWMYQVYSYAYSTQNSKPSQKIDFAILTDFQEFIVLDCTLYAAKPEVVNNFRVIDWKYSDYVEQFDMLWDLFERQNVLNASRPHDGRGAVIAPNDKPIAPNDKPIARQNDTTNASTGQDSSADKMASVNRAGVARPYGLWGMYLSPQKVKANRVAPDKAFLAQMDDEKDGWRVLLAKDMKKRNPRADGELITAAVQLLIDRLIFIKALSDREVDRDYLSEIESRVTESGLGENEAGWFTSCKSIFEELNNFYNGSIFEPRPELENVSVGNRAVQAVLHDLQPENSPYNFAVLPVEILGTIYERFLGRVVRTTEKRVTIEDKPEVRKAGGVYYTPQYIVDYIVENTLGKLLADCKTPADVAKLKILDPSCGSGSFLLGAYSKLIDWHKDYYARVGKEKRDRASFYRDEGGLIRLTAKLKRDILKNNLYGVDIDPQAVEVTRFSLSLKALEDLREGELTEERTLFHQTVLPDLSENIKNGNSLIGTDYFTGQMFTDAEDLKNVRPFDWNHEFKEIMSAGGFDCVIGNPPYSQVIDKDFKEYADKAYSTAEGRFDTFELFIEKGINLCKLGGLLGYIIPNPLLSNLYSRKLRKYILEKCAINEITNFGMDVFADPTIHTCIVILTNGSADKTVKIRKQVMDFSQLNNPYDYEIQQSSLGLNPNTTFDVFMDPTTSKFIDRISGKSETLGNICYIRQCIKTGNDKEYVKIFENKPKEPWKPTLRGRTIARYSVLEKNEYLKYGSWLARNWQNKTFYETPKIAIRETGNQIVATLDTEFRYFLSSLYAIYPKPSYENFSLEYLLGILNSKLLTYIGKVIALDLTEGAFTKFRTNQLARLPIRTLDLSKPDEKAQHDKMVALVEQMLSLHKSKAEAQTQSAQDAYERQIRAIDESIDRLVYQLYGLTPEEVKIVEG